MARYTGFFIVAVPIDRLRHSLIEILESCNLDIIYNTGDSLLARELPGQVSIPKLVTAEVLIEQNTSSDSEVRMNFVIKNEELPLKTNNHCRQMFELVTQSIMSNRNWRLLESMAL
ncbi:hypothetical protein [Microcoleus sp. CAWBG640]|uniref:hypothetical protein n=1 Tax=Microcoleus sp. CAWBG640 TaxID=2841653 RepID=UPI00312B471A